MTFFRAKLTVIYFGLINIVVLLVVLSMLAKKFNSCMTDTYIHKNNLSMLSVTGVNFRDRTNTFISRT